MQTEEQLSKFVELARQEAARRNLPPTALCVLCGAFEPVVLTRQEASEASTLVPKHVREAIDGADWAIKVIVLESARVEVVNVNASLIGLLDEMETDA
jgi:hypothetical protein